MRGAGGRALFARLTLGLAFVLCGGAAAAQQPSGPVLVTRIEGPITPVVADHVDAALDRAERRRAAAVVVTVDTPGGLDTSMRAIVQRFLAARVPVIAYVSPQGARAASAGALVTMAAHVAAMAPGTAIGAATPVNLEGGGDVERKIVNDAAAFAASIARLRGRDVRFATEAVREGRSASVDEAVEVGAVDLRAASLEVLLTAADGREVELGAGRRAVVRTAGAVVEEYGMTLPRRIQQLLADPNLAFLLLSLGTLAVVYELASPGVGAGAALGVTLILLALFSLSVLPVNVVGLLLLGLAAALFVAELFAPGVGIAAAGGTVALVLSGVFLFRDVPGLQVSLAVVAPIALVVGGGAIVAGRLVARSQRGMPPLTGPSVFIGRVVTVRRADGGRGRVFVEGAWWSVRGRGCVLAEGDVVEVVDVDGLDLVVEPVSPSPPGEQPTGES